MFEEFTNVHLVALGGFGVASIFGAVANKTHFCTMGAISDVMNMGSHGRMGAWVSAIGITLIGTQIMQAAGVIDAGESRFTGTSFNWLGASLGGLLFGIGMTLGAGCGQRNVVRLGGGNLKALVVLLVMGVTAYMTMRGLLGLVRINFVDVTAVDLSGYEFESQVLPQLIGVVLGAESHWFIPGFAVIVGLLMLGYAFSRPEFRGSLDNILAGFTIAATALLGWWITGSVGLDDFDPVPVESLSYIAPTGNLINYLMTFTGSTINFGIAIVLGTIAGSFVYAVVSSNFRIETFSNRSEMVSHLVGGALMGFGGVLSLGCTIGQGVVGFSTLATGSIIATVAIVFGSALTMKMQYNLMDDDIGFIGALGQSLNSLLNPLAKDEM